ncbi:MAG TPA: hypothetical protein VFV43_03765 [Limnobacter sp.]|nr:hypothetical protein [Limnobacter sp.]
MFVATRLSPQEVDQIKASNIQKVTALKQHAAPLSRAALDLAQTARDMKAHAESLKTSGQTKLVGEHGQQVSTKQLIQSLKSAKDALKSFSGKAENLSRELNFFDNHQQGLYVGNVAMVPLADKVRWCQQQVVGLQKQSRKLCDQQRPLVQKAISDIQHAAPFLGRSIQTSLANQITALAGEAN